MNSTRRLVELLGSGKLRVATGLWLLPMDYLGYEEDEARRLNLEPVDLRQRLLEILEPGTRFTGLSAEKIFRLVDGVSRETGDWAGAMIYNVDLLLARLSTNERNILWHDFFTALPHRQQCILLTIPETAISLLPRDENLDLWRNENRLVGNIRY